MSIDSKSQDTRVIKAAEQQNLFRDTAGFLSLGIEQAGLQLALLTSTSQSQMTLSLRKR